VGKSGEFYTFDEVIKYLQIPETKLKRLVSEGEIRAFREGDEMKFRRSDVENMDLGGARSEEETGVIDLSAGRDDSSETLTDDLIFDEGDDLDLTSADAGMATAEISSQDTLVDEDGIGMSTEPLGVSYGDRTDVIDDDDLDDARPARGARGADRPVRPAGPPPEPKDAGWAAVMVVTCVFMIMGFVVALGIRDSNHDKAVPETALKIAQVFSGEPKR
jgi:excisionase family DNA binding protein